MDAASAARVVVLSRAGCHLCRDAEQVIDSVCRDLDVSWQTVDVDTDEELRRRYTDHVPVTFVNGRLLSRWFLDEAVLRAALAS